STGRSVEQGVAREHIAPQRRLLSTGDGNRASRQTLTDIIVGLAHQPEVQAFDQESAEGLSRAADKLVFQRRTRRHFRLAQYLSTQMGADGAVRVGNPVTAATRDPGIRVTQYGLVQLAIQGAPIFDWASGMAGRNDVIQQSAQRTLRLRSAGPQPLGLTH